MSGSLPIRNVAEINLIKEYCKRKGKVRELLMFTLAINTGINLKDLLALRVKDVKDKLYLNLSRNKSIPLNEELLSLISLAVEGKNGADYLFQTDSGLPLNRVTAFNIFKEIYFELGLNEKYSVSSWRKTFAYHYYNKYQDLAYLMWLNNQSTVKTALDFIGLEENMNLRFREGVCL